MELTTKRNPTKRCGLDPLRCCIWAHRTPLTAVIIAVPGSHLRTAAHWEATATAAGRLALPRIYGTDIKERPGRNHERTTFSAGSKVGSWLRQQEPVPLLARRGQCTVMTTALLHSAWLNTDTQPRKGNTVRIIRFRSHTPMHALNW